MEVFGSPKTAERILSQKFEGTPVALLSLCLQHNAQILGLLDLQQQNTKERDVLELVQTTKQIQIILSRVKGYCSEVNVKDFNEESNRVANTTFQLIIKYESKIQKLQKQGSLLKFILHSRLRVQIDRLSNFICIQVAQLEKSVKAQLLESFSQTVSEEFLRLIRPIMGSYDEGAVAAQPKTPRSTGSSILHQYYRIKDDQTKQEMESLLSIVKNSNHRERMLSRIPRHIIKPLRVMEEVGRLESAYHPERSSNEDEKTITNLVFARSISTYPYYPDNTRYGDPVCDMYGATYYDNRAILVVADGCGWGVGSKNAANRATKMFVDFMEAYQENITTTSDAASLILQAYKASHKAIIYDKSMDEITTSCGSSTMLGGIILELAQSVTTNAGQKPFVFVFGSIGDCKAYLYSSKSRKIEEITKGNRGSVDMKDPGGRIGPNNDLDNPDLRNLKLGCAYCDENDIIMMVSDGVHDNLDPIALGKTPVECGFDFPSWNNLTSHQNEKIWEWSENLLTDIINKGALDKEINPDLSNLNISDNSNNSNQNSPTGSAISRSASASNVNASVRSNSVTPASIGRSVVKHVLDVTSFQRSLMQRREPIPQSAKGKLDHTTVLCTRIGQKKSWIKARLSTSSDRLGFKMSSEVEYTNQPGVTPLSPRNSPKNFMKKEEVSPTNFNLDIPCVLDVDDVEDGDPDVDRPVWNQLFGKSNFVVEWPGVVNGLAVALNIEITPEEEKQLKTILDYSNTGSVTRFKFLEFLKGFGPVEECVINVKRTVSASWFHGFITSNESKLFLSQQPVGTFLIRFSSSRPGSFVLDYVREIGLIRSVRLNSHPNGGFAAPIQGGDEAVFRNLDEIVEMYTKKNILRLPLSSTLPQQPWFFGDITEEDARQLLHGQEKGTFLVRFSQKVIGCFTACFVGENGDVNKGLFTPVPTGGYRVNNEGFVFQTLEDIVMHYVQYGIFTKPLSH